MPSITADLLDLMPALLTIERYTGEDQWGNDAYGEAVTNVRSRIEAAQVTMNVTTSEAGTTVADSGRPTTIITPYVDPPWSVRDRVTLPDATKARIVTVNVEWDETAPSHILLTIENNKEG